MYGEAGDIGVGCRRKIYEMVRRLVGSTTPGLRFFHVLFIAFLFITLIFDSKSNPVKWSLVLLIRKPEFLLLQASDAAQL